MIRQREIEHIIISRYCIFSIDQLYLLNDQLHILFQFLDFPFKLFYHLVTRFEMRQ